jgi:hypothetical protein
MNHIIKVAALMLALSPVVSTIAEDTKQPTKHTNNYIKKAKTVGAGCLALIYGVLGIGGLVRTVKLSNPLVKQAVADEVYINPFVTVPRTFSDVLAKVGACSIESGAACALFYCAYTLGKYTLSNVHSMAQEEKS